MAVVIVATVGGAGSNSFVLLSEAATYMTGRLNSSAWDDATTDEQNRALVEATRELDVLPWAGKRVDTTQLLSWPRQWVINPDDPNYACYALTVVPTRVKDATCELAFQFLKAGTGDVAAQDVTAGVIRKKVDVLETEWATPGQRTAGLRRYPRVWDRLSSLLMVGGGVNIPVIRG